MERLPVGGARVLCLHHGGNVLSCTALPWLPSPFAGHRDRLPRSGILLITRRSRSSGQPHRHTQETPRLRSCTVRRPSTGDLLHAPVLTSAMPTSMPLVIAALRAITQAHEHPTAAPMVTPLFSSSAQATRVAVCSLKHRMTPYLPHPRHLLERPSNCSTP